MILYSVFILFTLMLVLLVRYKLINIDLSFPWFISLILLAWFSTDKEFVQSAAAFLDIKNPPLVIILMTLFILLGLIMVLAIYITELRRRLNILSSKVALQELDRAADD